MSVLFCCGKGGGFINLFSLFGTIGLNDSDFNKGIADATAKGETFGAKLGKVMGDVGKAAAVGLGSAATALATFGTMSVKSFADYEQLTGGVETLFKDSASTVNEYAESAYKTAGMSANQYMDTITSFSASLIQGLGGDTKKAAEIGNLAIEDMADNSNKMGTNIEMIQNAYQGFAKDNFTMLDNLKLGYGGTAGEMARLVNESGILGDSFEATAENVKDIPFDQLVLAIHKVQTEMGITGTTALEASETITGSWNAMRASWADVLTALSSGNKDFLSSSIAGLASSANDFASNVMGTVTNLINNATEALPSIFTAFEPMLPMLFETLLPAVADGAVTLLTGLVQGIIINFPLILDVGGEIVRTLVEGIFGESDLLDNAFNGISSAFNDAMSAITESGLIQNIVDLLTKMGKKALEITPVVADIFSEGLIKLINDVSSVIGFLTDNFDIALAALIGLTAAMVTYKSALMITAIIDGVSKAVKAWKLATEGMTVSQWLMNAAMTANPIGIVVAAIAGLVAGIIYLWNTNEGFREALLTAWAHILNFFEGVPLFFQGVGNGISDAFSHSKVFVLKTVEGMVNGVIDIVNKGIEVLNKIPGVSIEALKHVAFATNTAMEEAEKRAERADEYAQKSIENTEKAAKRLEEFKQLAKKKGEEAGENLGQGITNSTIGEIDSRAIIDSVADIEEYGTLGEQSGESFSSGVADRINSNSKKTSKSAKKMSDDTYKNAKLWIEDYRNDADYMVENEIAMWEELAGQYEDKTKERIEIDTQITKLKKQQLKEQEKNEKDSIKAREKAEKDFYSQQKLYIEDYKNSVDYTAEGEMALWEEMSKHYAEKTKERVEIDKQVASLKEKIARDGFEFSKNWIEKEVFYNRLNTEEQISAWERVGARYEQGTKEREEADRNAYTLRKRQIDEQEKAEQEQFNNAKNRLALRKFFGLSTIQEEIAFWTEASAKYAEGTDLRIEADKALYESQQRLFTEQEKITAKMEAAEEKYAAAVDNRAQAIFNSFGLFDKLKEKEEVSSKTLTENLAEQVKEMTNWAANIEKLSERGINEGLLADLQKMGPSANAEIAALTKMSDYELTKYSDLYGEKQALARKQAEAELKQMREDTNKEINGLADDLNEIANTRFVFAGVETANGFIEGIKSKFSDLKKAVQDMAEIASGAITDSLEIASPSKLFKRFGNFTGQGFIDGIRGMSQAVGNAVDSVFGGLTSGGIEYDTSFGTVSNVLGDKRTLTDSAITPPISAVQSGSPIYYIVVENVSVAAEDMDSAAKVVKVFENFSHNKIVFEGVQ